MAIWGSISSWFVFLFLYSKFWPTFPIAPDMLGIDKLVFGTRLFWLGLALVPFTALIADVAYKVVKKTCFRTLADEISELDKQQRSALLDKSVSINLQLISHVNCCRNYNDNKHNALRANNDQSSIQ